MPQINLHQHTLRSLSASNKSRWLCAVEIRKISSVAWVIMIKNESMVYSFEHTLRLCCAAWLNNTLENCDEFLCHCWSTNLQPPLGAVPPRKWILSRRAQWKQFNNFRHRERPTLFSYFWARDASMGLVRSPSVCLSVHYWVLGEGNSTEWFWALHAAPGWISSMEFSLATSFSLAPHSGSCTSAANSAHASWVCPLSKASESWSHSLTANLDFVETHLGPSWSHFCVEIHHFWVHFAPTHGLQSTLCSSAHDLINYSNGYCWVTPKTTETRPIQLQWLCRGQRNFLVKVFLGSSIFWFVGPRGPWFGLYLGFVKTHFGLPWKFAIVPCPSAPFWALTSKRYSNGHHWVTQHFGQVTSSPRGTAGFPSAAFLKVGFPLSCRLLFTHAVLREAACVMQRR